MNRMLSDLKSTIEASKRIALMMHISPDGDTCGSALALCRGFLLIGKQVTVFCDDAIPAVMMPLCGADSIMKPEEASVEPFDLAIAVDVADRARMGRGITIFDAARHNAQIDHHGTNPAYASINIIRSPLSATGVLVAQVLDALGIALDAQIAECLYTAVATDTGSFRQQNTDADALRLAARCCETGFVWQDTARRLFSLRPLCQNKLLGLALSSMALYADGKIAVMTLTREDFRSVGALPEHTEGIINYALNTEGVSMACMVAERSDCVRCSLRALPPRNVARVAEALGGGGHALAAGCTLPLPIEAARETLLAALREELSR